MNDITAKYLLKLWDIPESPIMIKLLIAVYQQGYEEGYNEVIRGG